MTLDDFLRDCECEQLGPSATKLLEICRVMQEGLEKIAGLRQYGDEAWESTGLEPFHKQYARTTLAKAEELAK